MVRITIYVEGGSSTPTDNKAVQIIDNSALFREAFSKLFAKAIDTSSIDIVINPIGSIRNAKQYLEKITNDGIDGVLLIDLDAPEEQVTQRRASYAPLDATKIFFMIQEMEAWIISQSCILDTYGKQEGYIRKNIPDKICDNTLIKNRAAVDISIPSNVLDTLFRQYFDIKKGRNGQLKGKRYSKAKDGPNLIMLLNTDQLRKDFKDVASLFTYIKDR